MPTVTPTGAYKRDLKGLRDKVRQSKAIDALVLFVQNKHHSKLNFERVLSRKDYFTIRAGYQDRILLFKGDGEHYSAVAIGNHDYVYRGYFKK